MSDYTLEWGVFTQNLWNDLVGLAWVISAEYTEQYKIFDEHLNGYGMCAFTY